MWFPIRVETLLQLSCDLSLIYILSVTGPRTWGLEKAYTHGKTNGASKVATTY